MGTHIMPTMGGSSRSNVARHHRPRRCERMPWLIGMAFGSPVVPLVKSTRASSSSFSTVPPRSEPPRNDVRRSEHRAVDRRLERGAVRVAGNTDGATTGSSHQLLELGRLQLDIHQRGGRAETCCGRGSPRSTPDRRHRRQQRGLRDRYRGWRARPRSSTPWWRHRRR